jgi:hypothetical protein
MRKELRLTDLDITAPSTNGAHTNGDVRPNRDRNFAIPDDAELEQAENLAEAVFESTGPACVVCGLPVPPTRAQRGSNTCSTEHAQEHHRALKRQKRPAADRQTLSARPAPGGTGPGPSPRPAPPPAMSLGQAVAPRDGEDRIGQVFAVMAAAGARWTRHEGILGDEAFALIIHGRSTAQ